MKRTKKCQVCRRYNDRSLAIDAIIEKEGMILLIKRLYNPAKGYWALPGGHLDRDETSEQAVAREVKEETGLESDKISFYSVYSDPHRHTEQIVALAYTVKVSGIPKPGTDASDCRYFPLNSLPQKMAFDHKNIISDYIKSKYHDARR